MFDAVGNTRALIDARGNRHSFLYDADNREVALIDPLSRRTTSGYDAAGNQTLRIDARGNRTTYAFDAASQLTGRRYPDGSRVTFAWDENGNRTLMADPTGRYTWLYDALNRTRVNRQPNSKTITYSYDAVGNRATMRDPDGGRFTYSYDAVDRIGWLENPWNERTSFSYDAAGRRTLKKLANGTRASFTYDDADHVTKVAHFNPSDTIFSSFEYEYDNAGNRTSVLEDTGNRVTYSYDKTYQLTAEHRTGTGAYRYTYAYDNNGNRLVKETPTDRTTSTYDAANRLLTSQDATGTTTYTYDSDGNQRTVKSPANTLTTFSWDYENQNVLAELPDTTRVTQTYNGDLIVTERADSSGTKRFIWDENNILQETDNSDATLVRYDYAPEAFGELMTARQAGATLFYHFDVLGSTIALTNATGIETDTYIYDAWGNVVFSTGSTLHPFLWIGQFGYYVDSGTGLYILRRRVLRPKTGRFLCVDPIADDDVNGYRYVFNNSTNFVDPSGLILAAIDGTGSRAYLRTALRTRTGLWRSHVANFFDHYPGPGRAAYWNGPDNRFTGRGLGAIIRGAHNWICERWCASGCQYPIDMVGHSRGGHGVIQVAWLLQRDGCTCPNGVRHVPVPVRFLGLYDPVDNTLDDVIGEERISANVANVVVIAAAPTSARFAQSRAIFNRDSADLVNFGTRSWFINVNATHSAIGGAPWDGDHPRGHTRANDIHEAIYSDQQVRAIANAVVGLRIRQLRDAQYGY